MYLQEVFPPAQLGGRIHVIDYRSKNATRVSNYSSMKAELLGQNRGSELAQRYSGWLHELYEGIESAWELIDARCRFPVCLVGDADDIFLTLQCDKPYSGSHDSVRSYLEALREDVKEGRIDQYFWVPTTSMSADGAPRTAATISWRRSCGKGPGTRSPTRC